ncbi:FAD-dependent oxidoreductase [Terrihalobacillus insolitus]|uniref:FAD-dependent oxidoreductase n=1 Tax=Terrihalobacillus insolitus TaxID=2950438 RepID=UPI00234125DA|nr:NAD(P)/FAD-dependent oxidoreductase [Terrihalobacillus insolitus]MDC3411900.1 FAD-dependent monooxygenase [Terrihalobacillus insolitus]
MKDPVIIVGAGPVGVTLAEMLSQNGITTILLEKAKEPNREWRASTFHAGTLELLEETGVVEEMIKRGIKADKVQYRDRNEGLYAEFDFNLLKDETKYPYRLQLSQSSYVQIVYERLSKRNNIEIKFESEVIGYEHSESGVMVSVQTPNGIEEIRGAYLLGTDGGKSIIRKKLGVTFDGYTHEERWLLVGTPKSFLEYQSDLAYVNYISDPEQFLFILHVPGAWRFLYPVPPEVSDEVALHPGNIQKTMQKALNTTDTFPIVENTIYRIHQRVAGEFYKGRVVLVGDAAHLNSPMGGLGLNSGIHDAIDLSKRIIRIYHENANATDEFKQYNELRRRVATDYVKQISEKNTRTVKEKDPKERIKLQQEMADQANDPKRAKEWMLRSAMIASVREQGIGVPPKSVSK